MRLAILVSGRGSNLEAVLDAVAAGRLPDVEPVLVVSNRPDVRALEVAARYAVPSTVMAQRDFASADDRDAALGRAVAAAGANLALLAGYDQLLRGSYFDAFGGRTINIHPSLLPRHGGRGMIGMAVHASVLASGDAETGVTVHEVVAELDAGPPLAQERLAVRPGESARDLAARVLELEHRLLVESLARLATEPAAAGPSASMTAAPTAPVRSGANHERSASDA
jgi:phosphoribosylglycinamide formyltransferase-1